MPITTRIIASSLVFPLLWLCALPAAGQDARADAEAVVTRFTEALARGDTGTLESLMARELLQKRRPLLDNPTYPDHLRETYGGARFSIESVEPVGQSDIAVDVSIVFAADAENTYYRRFLLRPASDSAGLPDALLIYEAFEPTP